VRKPEGKRPLGRPRCRWVDNIKMDLGEVGWGDVDCIDLAQEGALMNTVMNFRVSQLFGNFLSNWTTSSFSRTLLHVVSLLVKDDEDYLVWVETCRGNDKKVVHAW
jgi:hypothetical protein